jgi:hypothetical protein
MSKTGKVKETILKYKEINELISNPELLKNQEYKESLAKYPIVNEYVKKITKINENDLTNIDDKHLTEKKQNEKKLQIETIEETKLMVLENPIKLKSFLKYLENNYNESIKELDSYDYS